MKNMNILGIIVLLSLLLVVSGCGDDEPLPVPAEDISVEDGTGDTGDENRTEEPELPDEPPQDVGGDVTEDELEGPEDADDEEEADDTADGAGDGDAEGAEGTNETGTDDVADDGDKLTAENYRVISLKDLKAYPEILNIDVGTTVEWRNVNDNLQHIIGWRGQKQMGVDPEPILQGESWSYTFTEPGEIKWFSTARPTIQGTINIEESEE